MLRGFATDEQRDVDAVERADGIVVDLDPREELEGAVDELHHDTLGRADGRWEFEQSQRDRHAAAEQRARADAEQCRVPDLARRAGDGDDLRRGHVCTCRPSTAEAYRRTVSSDIAAASS